MIPIALFKKFQGQQFIAIVEVSNIARCSSKFRYDAFRKVNSKGTDQSVHLLLTNTEDKFVCAEAYIPTQTSNLTKLKWKNIVHQGYLLPIGSSIGEPSIFKL